MTILYKNRYNIYIRRRRIFQEINIALLKQETRRHNEEPNLVNSGPKATYLLISGWWN